MVNNISVVKFGGTSVARYCDRMFDIVNSLSDNLRRNYVVVSAPGKVNDDDIKLTDILKGLTKGLTKGLKRD